MPILALAGRAKEEPHRTATTLELMFDLASVIAIAAAATGLHHGIAEGHAMEHLPGFLGAFFMIWWSWMNYTWFASAYDDGSIGFRVLSLTAMFGALTIAAGIPAIFAGKPIHLCLLGFVIMRVAMALFWFAAAAGDSAHRKTAISYGVGILSMQVFWVWMVLTIPPSAPLYAPLFVAGIAGELAVPAISESLHGATTWHRHHIIERYGLLNIIVLGECFVSIAAMLTLGDQGKPADRHGMLTAITAAAITFSMWGLYFTREEHLEGESLRHALLWGYGHFAIFAAGAATGAGFAVFHEVTTGYARVGYQTASHAVALPLAIYMLALWLVRDRFCMESWGRWILPGAALVVALVPMAFPHGLVPIALVAILAVAIRHQASRTRLRA